MSFAIRLDEHLWGFIQRALTVDDQERVLDLLDDMREHPGDRIDRSFKLPLFGAATYPVSVVIDAAPADLRIVFRYDSDESTLHINELLVLYT